MNAVDEGRRVQQAVAPAQQAEAVQTLYARRIEIYPRSRIGDRLAWFQKWRWAAVWATQIVFYGLPWLMWNERQAVLFDLGARRLSSPPSRCSSSLRSVAACGAATPARRPSTPRSSCGSSVASRATV